MSTFKYYNRLERNGRSFTRPFFAGNVTASNQRAAIGKANRENASWKHAVSSRGGFRGVSATVVRVVRKR